MRGQAASLDAAVPLPRSAPAIPSWVWVFASYLALFLILAARILPEFPSAIPARPNLDDSHVITWVLAWVSHSIATNPSGVFDANIAYPAMGQLTGTHHLFASQVAFAPVYGLTGNPLLAVNTVALLTYPLAAFAMERLLRVLGAPPAVAWVAGLVFALGALRVPFNLNLIQYPSFYLPWVALCLTKLRLRPDAIRGLALLLALGLALLADFYEAVLVGVASGIWGAFELVRSGKGRGRFLVLCICAVALASAALLVVARPYFAHLGHEQEASAFHPPFPGAGFATNAFLIMGLWAQSVGLVGRPLIEIGILIVAALTSVVAWATGAPLARRVVPVGLTLWLTGAFLSCGYPSALLPLVDASPLRMVRYTYRYVVVGDFGLVLLVAATLAALGHWMGRWAGIAITAALAVLVLVDRGVPFSNTWMHRVPALTENAAVYDSVAEIIEPQGGGPLLELPLVGSLPGFETPRPYTLEPDAMLASTRHWWPTPAAHTSYHAPHRWFFMNTVAALPAWWALDDLVDLTHVRWLLIRPASYWKPPGSRDATVNLLLAAPGAGPRWELAGGWLLLRLDRPPEHPGWFETAREAHVNGRTLLGTPLAPIAEENAVAAVQPVGAVAAPPSGANLTLRLTVRNEGDAGWPASPAPDRPLTLDGRFGGLWGVPPKYTVGLAARWWKLDEAGNEPPRLVSETEQRLRRDVDAGEEIRELMGVPVPAEDGLYELEVRVEQANGARFSDPRNRPYRHRLRVSQGTATLVS